MGKETDPHALQDEKYRTVDLIENERRAQELNWDLIYNAIGAASETIGKLRDDLMERRIAELAASTYPTLLESVLGMLVSVIPVSKLLEGMYQHLARSFKMRGIVGYLSSADGSTQIVKLRPEWAKFYTAMKADKPMAFLQDKRRWVYDIVEYDEAVLKFTQKINPALEGAIRGKLSAAASALGKPTVPQEELFSQKAPVKSASAQTTAAPDFLLELRDWVSMGKNADSTAYEKLKTAIERSQDIEQIKATRTLISSEATTPSGRPKEFNRELFRRYIEICILCMTWDFRPRFVPMARSQTVGSLLSRGLIQQARFELPPLGDKFWEFAADRYYDPYTDNGDKTYAQVGRSMSLGGAKTDDPELERYLKNPPSWEKGFYPAERLAYHFGYLIAPELFGMNREISQILQGTLSKPLPQSRPTELDTFYSYMLGHRQLEPGVK